VYFYYDISDTCIHGDIFLSSASSACSGYNYIPWLGVINLRNINYWSLFWYWLGIISILVFQVMFVSNYSWVGRLQFYCVPVLATMMDNSCVKVVFWVIYYKFSLKDAYWDERFQVSLILFLCKSKAVK